MTPRPIFIVGSGRSGTSILTWCLGQHANIMAMPETDWMTALVSWKDSLFKIGMAQHPSGHLSRWNVSRDAFAAEIGVAVDGIVKRTFEARFPDRKKSLTDAVVRRNQLWFRSVDDPKTRWVNGTPSCTGYGGVLAEMFPDGRFINLVRDPEAVVKSWMGASFRAPDMAEARSLVEHVYHSQRAGYLAHAAFRGRAMRVIFENLIADPDVVLRSILAFLGESYSADCAKPLAEKINSSGDVSDTVLREFEMIARSEHMLEMQGWYRAAQEPTWRIERDPETAADALAIYARHKIPLPD